jgi:hypothetical protein
MYEPVIDFEDETFEDMKEEEEEFDPWDWFFSYPWDDCDSCTGD